MRGRFITVEGGEGVGKSSFVQGLATQLRLLNRSVVTSREPGGTAVGLKVREIFANPPESEALLPETELMLVSAARAQHSARFLRPQLESGTWVVCDRYADSTRVYQGYIGGLPDNLLERVILATTFGLTPDLTLLLDCDPEISMGRIQARAEQDGANRYDGAKLDLHRKLRAGFLQLAKKFHERMVVLDASRSPEQVVEYGLHAIKDRLLV